MKNSPEQLNNPSSADSIPTLFNDHSLLFYWRLLRWPLFLGLVVDGLLQWENSQTFAVEFVHMCVLLSVVFLFSLRYKTSFSESLFVGGITGALLGFFQSFFAFVFQFELYLFFRIFYETFIWAVIGMVSIGAAHFSGRFLQKKFFKMENNV